MARALAYGDHLEYHDGGSGRIVSDGVHASTPQHRCAWNALVPPVDHRSPNATSMEENLFSCTTEFSWPPLTRLYRVTRDAVLRLCKLLARYDIGFARGRRGRYNLTEYNRTCPACGSAACYALPITAPNAIDDQRWRRYLQATEAFELRGMRAMDFTLKA